MPQWIWTGITIFMGMLSVFSCWYMSSKFLGAWWYPFTGDNATWIKFGVGIMILEFIVVHSGGLLTGISASSDERKKRWLLLSLLTAVYIGMAGLIAALFDSLSLFYSFASLMFCRLITGFFAVNESNAGPAIQRSVTSAMLYFCVVILSVAIPFPEGAIGSVGKEFLPDPGEGVWQQEPQRALAAGMIYFFAMGIYEIHAMRTNLKRSAEEAQARTRFYRKTGKTY